MYNFLSKKNCKNNCIFAYSEYLTNIDQLFAYKNCLRSKISCQITNFTSSTLTEISFYRTKSSLHKTDFDAYRDLISHYQFGSDKKTIQITDFACDINMCVYENKHIPILILINYSPRRFCSKSKYSFQLVDVDSNRTKNSLISFL